MDEMALTPPPTRGPFHRIVLSRLSCNLCVSRKFSIRFLVQCSIAERMNAIGVRKWRTNINNLVEGISSYNRDFELEAHFDVIQYKLLTYERAKDATFLLELALWKSKINELMPMNGMGES